ncbi:MAG: enoyl-CoA hydratase-related protein [Myxococcales bacterium]|jgi:enoyl-CoA hydratase
MDFENVRLEFDENIAILIITREKQLNSLNTATLREMVQAIGSLGEPRSSAVLGLIVTGQGKSFVSGADIQEMSSMTAAEAREFAALGHRAFAMLEWVPFPTIAAVNGYALGGGCELALACDLVLASEKAKFGQPEVNLGIIPGFGGTQRLVRAVGKQRAKQMIFTGEHISGARAVEIGLALEVLPPDKLLERAREIAKKIASKGPLAISQAKRVINWGADADLRAGNELEQQAFSMLFGTEDQKEGMKAFLEKRPARFLGR